MGGLFLGPALLEVGWLVSTWSGAARLGAVSTKGEARGPEMA